MLGGESNHGFQVDELSITNNVLLTDFKAIFQRKFLIFIDK